jgi:hypothetical protein
MRRTASLGAYGLFVESLERRQLLSAGIGTFVPGSATWSLRSTPSAGPADVGTFQFGANMPVVGDWNGDGKDDIGTFNAATATWSLRYGTSAGTPDAGVFVFGKAGTLPVVGDWNGDGRDDIGVYDPKKAQWFLRLGASAGPANAGTFTFGAKKALPVAGDWNGDGTDGIGTFEAGTATWTLRQTANAGAASAGTFKFGTKNTSPVVGDWNGDNQDGIGTVNPKTATWTLRQTASAGAADAGTFVFGPVNAVPVAGDWRGPAPTSNVLTSVTLKPLDLDLLGLEVQTSPVTITISSKSGDGKLIGNLLNSAANLINTSDASGALTNVLGTAVDLANGGSLGLPLGAGSFDVRPAGDAQVVELFVAPSHLDTLGVQIDTTPVRLSISAHAGQGLVLGNVMSDLATLFNPPLPSSFDVDTVNQTLNDLIGQVNTALGSIPAANVPTVLPNEGDVLTFAVPQLDLNLLGMQLSTDPVTFDAAAQSGDGLLLGNAWTAALGTLTATPDKVAQMNNSANAVLARVFGALNASTLTLSSTTIDALPPAVQALLGPTLFAPAGSSAPIMDLVQSSSGITPPSTIDLLGLGVASNNVNAHIQAVTGDGQILGNLLYNAANLTNPGASPSMLALLHQLATNSTGSAGPITPVMSGGPATPADVFNVTLPPLDLDLLGLKVQTGPMTVKLTAESGDGNLLGNVLKGYTSLLNLGTVSSATNNVLSTVTSLVNSVDLTAPAGQVGSGVFDTATPSTRQILDTTVAPVHINLTGAQLDTGPIHITMTAQSGDGLVLGNVLAAMADALNGPLPSTLDTAALDAQLQQLLSDLNAQIPGVAPAPVPASDPGNVLGVTVPGLNLDLLGMGIKTNPVVASAFALTGNGNVLGNLYTTALNTITPTAAALGGVSTNVTALLAKVVGVFNGSTLILPSSAVSALPSVYQTLASPTLINPTPGATAPILDWNFASASGPNPPTRATSLGLGGTTSSLDFALASHTGDGQILGNLLYNTANLLNPGSSSSYLYLLQLLA